MRLLRREGVNDDVFVSHIAAAINILFLVLVAACLAVGLLIAPKLSDAVRQKSDGDGEARDAPRVHVNGTGKRR